MENSLAVVVQESGITKTKGKEVVKALNTFFKKADEWNTVIEGLVINDVTEVGKMKMAREGRLSLKNMRLEAKRLVDEKRTEVKNKMADYVLEDKLWLKSYQMVEATYKNLEGKLEEKEKFAERKEEERKEQLEKARLESLEPYEGFYDVEDINLKEISDKKFSKILKKAKKSYKADKKEQKRLEKERIENEKEQERIRQENEKLKKEAEEKAAKIKKRNEELKPYIIFIRDYDKTLNLDDKTYKKELAVLDKAAKEHYKNEAEKEKKLEEERKEKAKLEKELNDKKEAEEKEKKRLEEEENRRKEAEKKAALAPQKEKIEKWVESFEIAKLDTKGFDKEGIETVNNITEKFKAFKKWAKTQIEDEDSK